MGCASAAAAGGVRFGTIDAWLAYKLTGRAVTDYSNASRTMLFDIEALRWDRELCEAARRAGRRAARSRCRPPSVLGETDPDVFLGARVPVAGHRGRSAGGAVRAGLPSTRASARTPTGPAASCLQNAGPSSPPVQPGLLTPSRGESASALDYAVEASVFVTGAAVQWLRDGLRIINEAAETERLAASLDSNEGVYFVPALTGLGSPHWDPYARGTIVGLTRGSGRAHLARATLESIAYQTVDAVDAMEAASGKRLGELRADGGAVGNRWLMQFQADVLGCPVRGAGGVRDDRARRRLPGRRRRLVSGRSTTCGRCGRRPPATSPAWAPTSAGPCWTSGGGRSSAPGTGLGVSQERCTCPVTGPRTRGSNRPR